MLPLRVVLGLACFVQAGWLALRATGVTISLRRTEAFALAFGVGVGLMTTQMLLYSIVGIRLDVVAVMAPWSLAWIAHLLHSRLRSSAPSREKRLASHDPMPSSVRWGIVVFAAAYLLPLLVRAFVVPLTNWDAWDNWDIKARAYFLHHSVLPFAADLHYVYSHQGYPLLYPLAGTFLYLCGGVHGPYVQVLSVAFYVAFVVQFHALVTRVSGVSWRVALALTAGAAALPNVLAWSQQYLPDIAVLYYGVSSVAYLYLFLGERDWRFAAIAGVSAGCLANTKIEGVLLAAPVAFVTLVDLVRSARQDRRISAIYPHLALVAVGVGMALPWLVFRRVLYPYAEGFNGPMMRLAVSRLPSLGLALHSILDWLSSPACMGAYVLVFPLGALYVLSDWRRYFRASRSGALLLMCVGMLAPYVLTMLVYMGTSPAGPVNAPWLTGAPLGRYLITFTGCWFFLVAVHVAGQSGAASAAGEGARNGRRWALAAATVLIVTFAIAALPHLPVRSQRWDFENGALGWRAGGNTLLSTSARRLVLQTPGGDAWIHSPANLGIDGAAHRSLRLRVQTSEPLGARRTGGGRLYWKPVGGVYSERQAVDFKQAPVVGEQSILIEPGWSGRIDEFRIAFRTAGSAVIRVAAIELEPTWVASVRFGIEKYAENPWPLVAALALLAWLLGWRSGPSQAVGATASVAGLLVCVLWIVPDALAWPTVETFDVYARPVSTWTYAVRDVRSYFPLRPVQRTELQEAQAGIGIAYYDVMRAAMAAAAPQERVVVLLRPDDGLLAYWMHRSSYLLYPRPVSVVTTEATLREEVCRGNVGALIVNGSPRQEEESVQGPIQYRAPGVGIISRPVLREASARPCGPR